MNTTLIPPQPHPTSTTLGFDGLDRDFLNSIEAAVYLNIKLNQLYKLNAAGRIPYYRPTGGKVYYLRSELHDWVLKGKRATVKDINSTVTKYITIKRNRP
jgi:excisionase family DNA binding protein